MAAARFLPSQQELRHRCPGGQEAHRAREPYVPEYRRSHGQEMEPLRAALLQVVPLPAGWGGGRGGGGWRGGWWGGVGRAGFRLREPGWAPGGGPGRGWATVTGAGWPWGPRASAPRPGPPGRLRRYRRSCPTTRRRTPFFR